MMLGLSIVFTHFTIISTKQTAQWHQQGLLTSTIISCDFLFKAVIPSHNAALLKNYICEIEGFQGANIFSYLTSLTVLNDGVCVAVMSYSGQVSYEKEPMFLLVKSAGRRTSIGFPLLLGILENSAKISRYGEVSSAAVLCFLDTYHPLVQFTIVSIIKMETLL